MKGTSRTIRATASGFAISWSIGIFIFFNFFEHNIALHHDGILEPLITGEFNTWLWIVNATLILSVIGHIILLIWDRYLLRESTLIFLGILGIATTATLLYLFPFDFSVIDSANVAKWTDRGVRIALIVTLVGMSIGTLVNIIKLTVNITRGTTDY